MEILCLQVQREGIGEQTVQRPRDLVDRRRRQIGRGVEVGGDGGVLLLVTIGFLLLAATVKGARRAPPLTGFTASRAARNLFPRGGNALDRGNALQNRHVPALERRGATNLSEAAPGRWTTGSTITTPRTRSMSASCTVTCISGRLADDIIRLHPLARCGGAGLCLWRGAVGRTVADACGRLILAEPAPGVRGRLIARFAPNLKIRVRSLDDLRNTEPASLDLAVMNSVAQYMTARNSTMPSR